jgi:pseudoazurin
LVVRYSLLVMVMVALASLWPERHGVAAAQATVEVVIDPATGQPRYEPPILYIEPGDSVLFKSAGSSHASRAIPGMQPEAADPWWGQVGTDLVVTFDEPGIYGHKCGANYRLGLVGLIVVGDAPVNLASARAVPHPPAAAAAFDELFAELEAHYRAK